MCLDWAQVCHAHFNRSLSLAGAPSLALWSASSIDVPLQAVQSIPHHISASLYVPKVALQEGNFLAEGMVGSWLHEGSAFCQVQYAEMRHYRFQSQGSLRSLATTNHGHRESCQSQMEAKSISTSP